MEIDGDLNHDGAGIGFRGKTPIAKKPWAVIGSPIQAELRNVSYAQAGASGNETTLARTLNTLIKDLRDMGILG